MGGEIPVLPGIQRLNPTVTMVLTVSHLPVVLPGLTRKPMIRQETELQKILSPTLLTQSTRSHHCLMALPSPMIQMGTELRKPKVQTPGTTPTTMPTG